MSDSSSLNPALGYNRFAEIVRNAETAVMSDAPILSGYGRDAVGRRLLQRIVELALHPFLQASAARHRRGEPAMPPAGATFESGGLRFDTSSAQVAVTAALWTRSLVEFAAQWLRVLGVVTRSALQKPRPGRGSAALLFGIGVDDILLPGSDRRFLDFCRRGPIAPLRNAPRLIVECVAGANSAEPSYCAYAKYPLFELIADHPARGRAWLRFLGTHIGTAVGFVVATVYRPLTAILARDLAFHALLAHLDRAHAIDSVIVTNSHYHVQPLWMRALEGRRFTSHMVWYSQNSIPFTYRTDGIHSFLPNHRYIEADDIWVWTEGFRDYLAARGARGRIHAVGPILWYLPDESASGFERGAIVVFDVTPQTPAFTHKVGLTYNYYRADNVRTFVADIIAARDDVARTGSRRAPILLKHKRTHSAHHDAAYLAFVDEANRARAIQTVATETNLYSLIAGAAVVVVIPYSSPAYVAAQLGVPAIYYDPSGEIVPTHEPHRGVRFVTGQEALRAALGALPALR